MGVDEFGPFFCVYNFGLSCWACWAVWINFCVNKRVCVCVQDSAGESLYMLFRAIKHQVDKGPMDAVTGKAKYTLNDNRLLREDVEYKTLVSRTLHKSLPP